jgi:DNA ligase D-like protein (predicted 3'-phosphoesterase)
MATTTRAKRTNTRAVPRDAASADPPKGRTSKKKAATSRAKSNARRAKTATARGAGEPRATTTRPRSTKATARVSKPAKPRTKAANSRAKPATVRAKPATSRSAGARDKLAVYRSKRDFGLTPEPQGKRPSKWKKGRNPFFVIQKHAASRLHYDFRLEMDGVLKSWAVPKGPSLDPADKRLAVETEDHPMDYADFEGIIPKDEYGGGTVIVWDAGPYRNLKRKGGEEIPMQRAYEMGTVEIWLEGKKIRGGFALVRSRLGGNDRNWLLIKMKDTAAEPGGKPVVDRGDSVLTGRTIDEVAGDPKKVWSSNR